MGPEGPDRKSNASGGLSQVRGSGCDRHRSVERTYSTGVPKTLLALVLVVAACGSNGGIDATTPSPTVGGPYGSETLFGFTPFPARPSLDGVLTSYRIAAEHGDLVAHHLDDCVPWGALTSGSPLPESVEAALRLRQEQTPEGSAVYLATSFSAIGRDAMAPDCAEGGVPPPPDSSEALDAAKDWIDLLVERLHPAWVNVGVEINLVAQHDEALGTALEQLAVDLGEHIDATHPDIETLVSLQADSPIDPDSSATLAAAMDLIGLSIYPTVFGATDVPPDDALDELARLGRPLVVAETGWPGDDDPAGQAEYVTWLGRVADRHRMAFVVWFFPADPDPLFVDAPPDLAVTAALFSGMGLITAEGSERPALAEWDRLRLGG